MIFISFGILLFLSLLCTCLGGSSCQSDDGWEGSWFHLWDGWWSRQTNQGNQRGLFFSV